MSGSINFWCGYNKLAMPQRYGMEDEDTQGIIDLNPGL